MAENIIDDAILNTSPKEPTDVRKQFPSSREIQTFVNLNKGKIAQPNKEIILDLNGEETVVEKNENSITQEAPNLTDVLGDSDGTQPALLSPAILLMISWFIFTIFVVIVIAQKSSSHIQNLEKELDNVKKGKISSLT